MDWVAVQGCKRNFFQKGQSHFSWFFSQCEMPKVWKNYVGVKNQFEIRHLIISMVEIPPVVTDFTSSFKENLWFLPIFG